MFLAWLNDPNSDTSSLTKRLFPPIGDRAFWESKISAQYISKAEETLGCEWPTVRATQYREFEISGNRLAQETPHYARRRALLTLFLGELAEDRGRFLPDLTDGLFAVCEETFWGLSAHCPNGVWPPCVGEEYIDLFAAETAELLAVILHVLGDRLSAFCPSVAARVEHELRRRIVVPYLAHEDWWWMGYHGVRVNNWLPWIAQNLLTVYLTLDVDATVRDRAVRKSMTEIDRYYASLPDDGGCDEGADYWTKAGANLFMYCDLLYRVSDGAINLFGDAKLKRIGMYSVATYITGVRFANFADSMGLRQGIEQLYAVYGFGLRTGTEALCRLASSLKRSQMEKGITIRGYSAKHLLWSLIYEADILATPPLDPPSFALLPDLQNAFLRQGTWYLAAKGGHNDEGHNHNDVGSFMVFEQNTPVLVDPGIGAYTRQTFSEERYSLAGTQSAYHNVPLIGGEMQGFGASFKADRFHAQAGRVEIDFASAYPASAGVSQVARTLTLTENGVTMTDRFVCDGSIDEHFMTPLSVEAAGDTAVLGGRYRLRVEGAVIETDTMAFDGDPKYTTLWNSDHLTRLRFHLSSNTAHMTLERLS